ncbi:MAG: lipopolysaccharide biosynthesis protein [Paludibacter sp.]|nr:lipopolysaccharide biosynthesis protein [Paludibacter sp.]
MGDNLKSKTISVFAWSTFDRFGQQLVQFIIGLILARLLSPHDFGLIGMVMIFASLSFVLVESGFGQALVRKKNAGDREFSTIFFFNIGVSILLYTLLFFSAPLIAAYFSQPQLTVIARVIFISIPFNALYLVQFVKLGVVLDFKSIAKVNIISTSVSGLFGLSLAFFGYGVWALVVQTVLYHLVRMICFIYFVRWKPIAYFSLSVIREFFGFSINLLGTGVLNVIFNNLYVFLLGKFYSIQQVGYYTQANKLGETANFTFISILSGSTYNLFIQVHDQLDRLLRIFREIIRKTSLITIPIFMFLIAAAHPLIFVLLGEKWLNSVIYLQLICAANIFAPLYVLNFNLLNSRGKSKVTFKIELVKKSLIILSVAVCFSYGIIPMLLAYIFVTWLSFFISLVEVKREIKHYWKNQITDILPSFGVGLLIAIGAFMLSLLIQNNHFLLITQIAIAIILYLLSIKLFFNDLFDKGLTFIQEKLLELNRKI